MIHTRSYTRHRGATLTIQQRNVRLRTKKKLGAIAAVTGLMASGYSLPSKES